MFDHRSLLVRRPSEGDDVEPSGVFQKVVAFQITERQLYDPPLLVRVNRFRGMPFIVRSSRLHFHKHHGPPIDGNDINLAQPTIALVGGKDDITLAAEKLFGQAFPTQSKRCRLPPASPPCSQATPNSKFELTTHGNDVAHEDSTQAESLLFVR